ncbi:DUF1833 domain-containing protein [Gammaproteobacteria bacterium]|nr:DUF1833 domain-containing protein [Gammaproteobacteria bacterium]
MAVTLSDAYRESLLYVPNDIQHVEALSIIHPNVDDIHIVKDYEDFTGFLDDLVTQIVFTAGFFSLKMPTKGNSGVPDISFAIGNTDGAITEYLEQVKLSNEPVELTYRVYLSSDPSSPVRLPSLTFQVRSVSVSRFQATGRAVFARDLKNTKVPRERYTRTRFPGL